MYLRISLVLAAFMLTGAMEAEKDGTDSIVVSCFQPATTFDMRRCWFRVTEGRTDEPIHTRFRNKLKEVFGTQTSIDSYQNRLYELLRLDPTKMTSAELGTATRELATLSKAIAALRDSALADETSGVIDACCLLATLHSYAECDAKAQRIPDNLEAYLVKYAAGWDHDVRSRFRMFGPDFVVNEHARKDLKDRGETRERTLQESRETLIDTVLEMHAQAASIELKMKKLLDANNKWAKLSVINWNTYLAREMVSDKDDVFYIGFGYDDRIDQCIQVMQLHSGSDFTPVVGRLISTLHFQQFPFTKDKREVLAQERRLSQLKLADELLSQSSSPQAAVIRSEIQRGYSDRDSYETLYAAVERGNTKAIRYFAESRLYGVGCEIDRKEGLLLARKGANAGEFESAMVVLREANLTNEETLAFLKLSVLKEHPFEILQHAKKQKSTNVMIATPEPKMRFALEVAKIALVESIRLRQLNLADECEEWLLTQDIERNRILAEEAKKDRKREMNLPQESREDEEWKRELEVFLEREAENDAYRQWRRRQ